MTAGDKAAEGGIHGHLVDRLARVTAVDGSHAHVFLLPEGTMIETMLDGAHSHPIAELSSNETEEDTGQHSHGIVINGQVLQTGAEASGHSHELQVKKTAFDGSHVHTLILPSGEEIKSLTPGEFAAIIAASDGFGAGPSTEGTESGNPSIGAQRKKKQYSAIREAAAISVIASGVHQWTLSPIKVECKIRKKGEKFEVVSEDGSRSFGTFDTREEAEKRLREIEFFKTKAVRDLEEELSVVLGKQGPELAQLVAERVLDEQALDVAMAHSCPNEGHVGLIKDHRQQDTELGSPETIIDMSMQGARQAMRQIAEQFFSAISKAGPDPTQIFQAVNAVKVDQEKLAAQLERRIIHGLMLGALDSSREDLEAPAPAEVSASRWVKLQNDPPDFSKMRFQRALEFFRRLRVVTPAQFARLRGLAKQRAFSVSGVMSRQMLRLIQSELATQIGEGADLRKFRKFAETRLKSAGFLATRRVLENGQAVLSSSHVETTFRTNVLNAYNAGRATHQLEPEVVMRRPVWEIRAIIDGRTRKFHKDADGKKLLANDPFWQSAYPPFGFNCRCRVVTRPRSEIDQTVSGSTIRGLPDPGFSSGISVLL